MPLLTIPASSINGLHFESHDTQEGKTHAGDENFYDAKSFSQHLHHHLDKDHTEAVVLFLADRQKAATRARALWLRYPGVQWILSTPS